MKLRCHLSIYFLLIILFNACSTPEDNLDEIVGFTHIPDDKFEQWLIDEGYDDKLDNYILTENAKNIKELCADNYSIDDFTGIEDFTSLESLCVYWGDFTSINLNNNINLKALLIQGNFPLSTIDLSKNTKLQTLNLWGNSLTNIDLSNNIQLTRIDLSGNDLSEFNPNIFKDLEELYLNDNNLYSLDISDNFSLEKLTIRNNFIENIEINHLNKLNRLDVGDNKLQSLDVSQNIHITHLNASGNLLECIKVNENQHYIISNNTSISEWYWSKDDNAQYSLDCN